MKKVMIAAALSVGALLVATPVSATPLAPAPTVQVGVLVEMPTAGFFPSLSMCNAERASYGNAGFWTSNCWWSKTNRGYGFNYQ